MEKLVKLPLHVTDTLEDGSYDAYLFVSNDLEKDLAKHKLLDSFSDLKSIKSINNNFEKEVTLTSINNKRVIYSPTGPLNRDYDDVRRIYDAARDAMKKAVKAGAKRPLLINTVKDSFELSDQVALLGALEGAYTPLEVRESKNTQDLLKVEKLGYWHSNLAEGNDLIKTINAIEIGRIVTRDIGGSDPERMSAENVLKYVRSIFDATDIKISVVEGQENFEKNYPCFAAVNRAAEVTPRHRGKIIKLEYNPPAGTPIDTTLFLVGKGITYDTGGADVKAGGHMAGMHRDKCGAAFVAGFFKSLDLVKPKGLKVYGTLCMARNSIGEECYVADEIITTRAQKRVRVGNTDAEGRMVMVDNLCEAKEMALNAVNPHIFTIATLTGHVIRAYGPDYTAILANGPGKAMKIPEIIRDSGDLIGDMYEISTLRREDYTRIEGKSEYEDLLQCNNEPSSATSRGHQFPAAFMIEGSGLDKHGNDSSKKLPYCHVDIAGSSGPFPGIPTAHPLPSFFKQFVQPRI